MDPPLLEAIEYTCYGCADVDLVKEAGQHRKSSRRGKYVVLAPFDPDREWRDPMQDEWERIVAEREAQELT